MKQEKRSEKKWESAICNYGWLFLCAFFFLFLVVAYKIVDAPEQVGAEENPYNIPQAVVESAERWGDVYGISPEFLEAVAWAESRYNPNVSNSAGTCHGLMQIKYTAHSHRMNKLGVTSLFDLDGNMVVAADYFAELFEEYEDPALVLMLYHGEGDAQWKYDNGKMSSYASGVLEMSYELETLHGKHSRAKFDPDTVDWEHAQG